MQIDQRAEYYLTTFFDEQPFPAGLAFKTALRQSKLDFSLASLDRIDYLLDQIGQRFTLTPEHFLQKTANADFVYLLGFYLGVLAAQHSRVPPEWQEQADGQEKAEGQQQAGEQAALEGGHLGSATERSSRHLTDFATRISCVLGGKRLFFPLQPVMQRLFYPQAGQSVRRLTEQMIVPGEVRTRFRLPQAAQLAGTVPSLLPHAHSMQLAGWVAAQALAEWLQAAPDGQVAAPQSMVLPLLGQILPGGEQVLKKIMDQDQASAIASGQRALLHNPEQARSMALCYVAAGRLPNGRTGQAWVIEVCTHQPEALSVTLQVPFERQRPGAAWVLHELTVLQSSAPPEALSALLDYFYAGVHEQPRAAQGWARHLLPVD
jgi:hypothetical protein